MYQNSHPVHIFSSLMYDVVVLIFRSVFICDIRPMVCLYFLSLVHITCMCLCLDLSLNKQILFLRSLQLPCV